MHALLCDTMAPEHSCRMTGAGDHQGPQRRVRRGSKQGHDKGQQQQRRLLALRAAARALIWLPTHLRPEQAPRPGRATTAQFCYPLFAFGAALLMGPPWGAPELMTTHVLPSLQGGLQVYPVLLTL